MSCNYFIITKDPEMAFDLMPRVNILQKERVFEIHLCQTIHNRKPLFENHSYNSFKELKEILTNEKYKFHIEDEYSNKIEVNDFIKTMEKLNAMEKTRTEHYSKIKKDPDGFEFLDSDFC